MPGLRLHLDNFLAQHGGRNLDDHLQVVGVVAALRSENADVLDIGQVIGVGPESS